MGAQIGRNRSPLSLFLVGGFAVLMAWQSGLRGGGVSRGYVLFGNSLRVPQEQVFYASPSGRSIALRVRPILPNHVVVVPQPPVQRLAELSDEDTWDLFETARVVQRQLVGATAFNWALKDGPAAGQPIGHVHLHVVPRLAGDLVENDLVYQLLDRWHPAEGQVNAPPSIDWPEDEERRPRTEREMAAEALEYRALAEDRLTSGLLPSEEVPFGKFKLRPSQVFFVSASGLSLATVNLKPLVPGHVLVISRRVVPSIADLPPDEMQDLWGTVRDVQALMQQAHGTACSTLGMQDGRDAGQSVPHVHVHVLPAGKKRAH